MEKDLLQVTVIQMHPLPEKVDVEILLIMAFSLIVGFVLGYLSKGC